MAVIWVWLKDSDLRRGKAASSGLARSVRSRLRGVGGLLLSYNGDGSFLVEGLATLGC